jgi:hypothetical protein
MSSRSKLYSYSDGNKFKDKNVEEIFTSIAEENFWIEDESVSGFGSSLQQSAKIVKELPEIFSKFEIKSVIDIPCGDFNWMRTVDLSKIDYTGADIVKKIINKNIEKYETASKKFTCFDLLKDNFDNYDLVFCRDCLVHFSFANIKAAIQNIKNSKSKYLMMTTFPEEDSNEDIQTGGWRPLNFEKPPFSFGKPVYLLNENCTEMDGVFHDKSLGIWIIDEIVL